MQKNGNANKIGICDGNLVVVVVVDAEMLKQKRRRSNKILNKK